MIFNHFPFHEPKALDSILGISSGLLGFIGTMILGALALFGDQLRKFFFKPEIKGIEIKKTPQEIGDQVYIYHRLIVKNIGGISAKEVRALLTYFDANNAKNFIPVPLNWTHWNKMTRDISRKEPAYLDLIRKTDSYNIYEFCWSQEVGTPWELNLSHFEPEFGNLRIEFYERDNKVGDIILKYSKKEDEFHII